MKRQRNWVGVAGTAATVLALVLGGAACSEKSPQPVTGSTTLGVEPQPIVYDLPKGHLVTLTYEYPQVANMEALLEGRLESVVKKDKVYFYFAAADGLNYGLVLPWGYSASKDGTTAYFEGAEVATTGTTYQAGGGHVPAGEYSWPEDVHVEGIFASSGLDVIGGQ